MFNYSILGLRQFKTQKGNDNYQLLNLLNFWLVIQRLKVKNGLCFTLKGSKRYDKFSNGLNGKGIERFN